MSTTTNLAAEFFVASQLFRLGYTVTLTLGNTKEIDLFVAHPDGRTITIDSKGLKNKTNWPLTVKLVRDTHFFVLVSFLDRFSSLAYQPDVFVIPSTQIHTVLERWSGRPDVTCVDYHVVRKTSFKDAWHLLFNESPDHALQQTPKAFASKLAGPPRRGRPMADRRELQI